MRKYCSILLISVIIIVAGTIFTQSSSLLPQNTYAINSDPLPSWNQGKVKETIINFVKNITNPTNANYVPPDRRIATFDNDGTLWSEKPVPFQAYFLFDRLPAVIAKNPELKNRSPFREILSKNFTAVRNMTEKDVMDLALTTHSNMSQSKFDSLAHQWAKTARHPQTKRLFVDMVYQPMLELLSYLKANQFKVFIVSGGGVDFMRDVLSSVYGIPPEQIIGSSLKYQFVDKINSTNMQMNNNKSFIFRQPALVSFDDAYEKPVNIQVHIGQAPIMAVGNSDGDLQMLQYVNDNNPYRKSLLLLVHHDDALREYKYDKGTEKALEVAKQNNNNWTIVSMKEDWKHVYPLVNAAK
jgi:phosphoglycolate phosphatase-like HAD superfamily hydrolase